MNFLKKYKDNLILDILSPTGYSYFKIKDKIAVEEIPRQLYSIKNTENIKLANKLIDLGNCSSKAEYLICNNTLEKFYYIRVKNDKIKIYCPKKINIKNIFGGTHFFEGPEIFYRN